MTVQVFVKGLFMALISVAVMFFSQTPIQWGLLAMTAIATVLAYAGTNLLGLIPDESPANKLVWWNLFSALLLAISTGITNSLAMLVIDGQVEWLTLGKVVIGVVFTFIATTFFSAPKSQSKML